MALWIASRCPFFQAKSSQITIYEANTVTIEFMNQPMVWIILLLIIFMLSVAIRIRRRCLDGKRYDDLTSRKCADSLLFYENVIERVKNASAKSSGDDSANQNT